MEQVIIDSTGWIEYFTNSRRADGYAAVIESASPDTHFTPSIVFYEVFKRIARERGEETALEKTGHILLNTRVVELTSELAIEAAKESASEDLPMADAIIYATAKRHDAKLYTSDKHFKNKKGVQFIE